jgi:nitrilase
MFVIGCCIVQRVEDIPDKYEFKQLHAKDKVWVNRGNSCIVSPKAEFLAGPTVEKEEILYADLDMSLIPASKWILDTAGNYARPDVFKFAVNRRPNRVMEDADSDA